MPGIVYVWMYDASTGIGLDQYLWAFARLPEESPVRRTIQLNTVMATCHSWIDTIGIYPIRGHALAYPVVGHKWNRS